MTSLNLEIVRIDPPHSNRVEKYYSYKAYRESLSLDSGIFLRVGKKIKS
jgi:hypothetical protein